YCPASPQSVAPATVVCRVAAGGGGGGCQAVQFPSGRFFRCVAGLLDLGEERSSLATLLPARFPFGLSGARAASPFGFSAGASAPSVFAGSAAWAFSTAGASALSLSAWGARAPALPARRDLAFPSPAAPRGAPSTAS